MGVALGKVAGFGRSAEGAGSLRTADALPHGPGPHVHVERVSVDTEEDRLLENRRNRHSLRKLGAKGHAGVATLGKRECAQLGVLRARRRQARGLGMLPGRRGR